MAQQPSRLQRHPTPLADGFHLIEVQGEDDEQWSIDNFMGSPKVILKGESVSVQGVVSFFRRPAVQNFRIGLAASVTHLKMGEGTLLSLSDRHFKDFLDSFSSLTSFEGAVDEIIESIGPESLPAAFKNLDVLNMSLNRNTPFMDFVSRADNAGLTELRVRANTIDSYAIQESNLVSWIQSRKHLQVLELPQQVVKRHFVQLINELNSRNIMLENVYSDAIPANTPQNLDLKCVTSLRGKGSLSFLQLEFECLTKMMLEASADVLSAQQWDRFKSLKALWFRPVSGQTKTSINFEKLVNSEITQLVLDFGQIPSSSQRDQLSIIHVPLGQEQQLKLKGLAPVPVKQQLKLKGWQVSGLRYAKPTALTSSFLESLYGLDRFTGGLNFLRLADDTVNKEDEVIYQEMLTGNDHRFHVWKMDEQNNEGASLPIDNIKNLIIATRDCRLVDLRGLSVARQNRGMLTELIDNHPFQDNTTFLI